MSYTYLHDNTEGAPIFAKIEGDGVTRLTCVQEYSPFQEWLRDNQGNLPNDIQDKIDGGTLTIQDAD